MVDGGVGQAAGPPPPVTAPAWVTTLSTNPYSRASGAVNQRSRSESAVICSTDLPVCSAISSASTVFMCRISWALMRTSVAVPPMPPDGWCIITRACGVA